MLLLQFENTNDEIIYVIGQLVFLYSDAKPGRVNGQKNEISVLYTFSSILCIYIYIYIYVCGGKE